MERPGGLGPRRPESEGLLKFLKLALVPFAFLAVGLIRLLSRFGILIRFGEFWSARVGHLAGNTECYLCERDEGMHKGFDIWTHRGLISNKYLGKMLKRCMLVDTTRFSLLVMLINQMFEGWEKHTVGPQQYDRDIGGLFLKHPPHLKFTKAEERLGLETLGKWGIPEDAKIVCLIVRDGAYLPHLSYHALRDSDIKDYRVAILELVRRGYYVFRMGAAVKKPLLLKHSKVFDYATNGMRSEFMDIYLGSKCEFCISTGTGFDAIPYVFRRPVCYVNFTQVEYLFTFTKSLAIFKHHHKDGKRMTLQEIWDSGCGQFMGEANFKEAGISVENNTPDEIADVVREMVDWVEGGLQDKQDIFWHNFPRSVSPYNGKPLHGDIRMRIGEKFLEGYQ